MQRYLFFLRIGYEHVSSETDMGIPTQLTQHPTFKATSGPSYFQFQRRAAWLQWLFSHKNAYAKAQSTRAADRIYLARACASSIWMIRLGGHISGHTYLAKQLAPMIKVTFCSAPPSIQCSKNETTATPQCLNVGFTTQKFDSHVDLSFLYPPFHKDSCFQLRHYLCLRAGERRRELVAICLLSRLFSRHAFRQRFDR